MPKELKLKDGAYDAYLGILQNDFVTKTYRVDIRVTNGNVTIFKGVKEKADRVEAAPPIIIGGDSQTEGGLGDINWLFVFVVAFAAIAAFHLFVK